VKLDARKLAIAAVLTVGVAASWWLVRITEETDFTFDGKARHDPDFIVENFHSVVMSASGKPQYELRAKKLMHYGDDGSSAVDLPYVIQYTPGRAATHARAQHGYVPQETTYIRLTGDVHVAQGRDPRSAGADIRVQTLTLNLDKTD
jgi:lipopolysaccharide export system protein LptC